MTAELVRGQNHPLPGNRLEIRVSAGTPVVAAVTLGDEQGRRRRRPASGSPTPARRTLPGVEVPGRPRPTHRLAVDLGAMPRAGAPGARAARPAPGPAGRPADFGAAPPPALAVTTRTAPRSPDSPSPASARRPRCSPWSSTAGRAAGRSARSVRDTPAGCPRCCSTRACPRRMRWPGRSTRRSTASRPARWTRPRRVPRGREPARGRVPARPGAAAGRPASGRCPAPAAAVPAPARPRCRRPQRPPPGAPAAPRPGPAARRSARARRRRRPPAARGRPRAHRARRSPGTPPGWTMEERLYNQVWGMFEDLARTVAAYRSAVDFAESRLRAGAGPAAGRPAHPGRPGRRGRPRAGAGASRSRWSTRPGRCSTATSRQLTAEAEVVEPALPPAVRRLGEPGVARATGCPPGRRSRCGWASLHLPEAPELRIPLLVPAPAGARPVDRQRGRTGQAPPMDAAVAIAGPAARLSPPGGRLRGARARPGRLGRDRARARCMPAARWCCRRPPRAPPGSARCSAGSPSGWTWSRWRMRGGAADALPPGFDTAEQLLIVNEFPYGFDDRAVTQLRYLADEGPAAGVHLLLVADRDDASAYGPVLDPLWRSMLRLTPLPERPPGRSVGGPRVDVRARAGAAGQPGGRAGAARAGGGAAGLRHLTVGDGPHGRPDARASTRPGRTLFSSGEPDLRPCPLYLYLVIHVRFLDRLISPEDPWTYPSPSGC